MLRKPLILLCLLSFGLVLSLLACFPALAAPNAQQQNPPEQQRPDQYSYQGPETIPYLAPQSPPGIESVVSTASPVQQWSKMTFQSYVGDGWDIYYASGSFTNLVRLTNNGDYNDINPRLNRGATRIAFASDRVGHNFQIFTMNVDGSDVTQLTFNNADNVRPVWSPNGAKIAFQSYRDGQAEVYVMNANGSGQARLTYGGGYNGEPTWSPDGSYIAYTSYMNDIWRLWVMDANGANKVQLSQQAYSENPVWSPDGSQILYDADADLDDMQELWLMNSDGSNQIMKVDGNTWYQYGRTIWANGWAPDNSYITYTDVELHYYQGYWYWDMAWIFKLDQYNYSYPVNNGRFTDWNLDWTTSDNQPPSTRMNAPASPASYQFPVTWSGYDGQSGLTYYDVQVKDGTSGTWTDLLTHTNDTSLTYIGLGGHTYYFRTRARDNAYNLGPWPNAQAHVQVESLAPISQVADLDTLTRGNQVTLNWEGVDEGGSGVAYYDVQFLDESLGTWEDWLTNTTLVTEIFIGEPGHSYHFRSRAIDNAMNVEAWPPGDGDTTTTFYNWLTTGVARDNIDTPVVGMDIDITPQALISHPSDNLGKYLALVGTDQEIKTITWSKSGYGTLPATEYGIPDAHVEVYLPPADNVIQDEGFESGTLPGAWQAGGDFTPIVTDTVYHSGNYAASMGVAPSLGERVIFNTVNPENLQDTSPIFFADKLGGLHMAWIEGEYPNPLHNVYYMHRHPDGSWSTPELVGQYNIYSDHGLGMVVDEESRVHMLIGWASKISYTMRDTSGNWTAPIVLIPSGGLIGMKIDDSFVIHAVYRTYNTGAISYARLEPGGTWQIQDLQGAGEIYSINFAINPQGVVGVGWISINTSQAFYMWRTIDGNWHGPLVFARPSVGNISMVVDSAGVSHIIFKEYDPEASFTYMELDPDGTWTAPYKISSSGMYPPKLMIDSNDTIYLMWSDYYNTGQIYFMEKTVEGEWTAPLQISYDPYTVLNVQADVSGSGDVFIVWATYANSILTYSWRHAGIWSGPTQYNNTNIYGSLRTIYDAYGGVNVGWMEAFDYRGYNFLGAQQLEQSGISTLSQSVTVPLAMDNPTLSLLATLSGVSPVSGNEFTLQVTSEMSTTTLISTSEPTAWEHYWFDLSPWSGQQITLTFRLTENAGYPPANAILDEVTLGAAHTDVWLELAGGPLSALPGDQFTFQLEYGNRSALPAASSAITVTLPTGLNFIDASTPPTDIIGNQLVWQVGELPPDSTYSPIMITVQVDFSAPLGQTMVTEVEITTTSPEIEILNNTPQFDTFIGYLDIVPLLMK
jgi:Tol biopolymer transport system component